MPGPVTLGAVEHRRVGGVRALTIAPRSETSRLLLFLPGFLASPASYRSFLRRVAGAGSTVVAPRLYRPTPAVLAGRFSADDEAEAASRVLEPLRRRHDGAELWLAGHSRGGQVAWLLAGAVGCAGLIAIDPVDGVGPRPTRLHAAAQQATFSARTLVVGAGIGGRCAPAAMGHRAFAAVAPPGSTHIVLPSMGHGDLLDDRRARLARHLCGGSDDARRARDDLVAIVTRFIDGDSPSLPGP